MYLTIKQTYKPNKSERKLLNLLCHISKNIYNSYLYVFRYAYFNNIEYVDQLLNKKLYKNENFKLINQDTTKGIRRKVVVNMNNFKNGYIKIPNYLEKHAMFPIFVSNPKTITIKNNLYFKIPYADLTKSSKIFQTIFEDELINCFIKESALKESFEIFIKIPRHLYKKQIREVIIKPKFNGLEYEILYSYIDDLKPLKLSKSFKNIMAIDLGINNLASIIVSNNKAFIIDGKHLKSINQYYNKQIAHYSSIKPNNKKLTKKEFLIHKKRNNRTKDYIDKASKQIIKIAIENEVSEIIIGFNYNFKTKSLNLKKANQLFKEIPLSKFKDLVISKAKKYSIKTSTINEAYTSLCSFYDNESIKFHYKYQGTRISRGLFKTKNGIVVNADINAALNILKKSKPERTDILSFLRNSGQAMPCRLKEFL